MQDIISQNKFLSISESVEHNAEEQNIQVDNLVHLLNFETGTYVYIHSRYKNYATNTVKYVYCIHREFLYLKISQLKKV